MTVLDTPGLADTRGLEKDNEHKQSINAAIRDNIPEVTAVIILANGRTPRLGAATDYALTTLCSIFPRTLAENIGILFTNVSSHTSLSFEVDTLPIELRGAKNFLIDNPLAMQKKYQKYRGKIDEKEFENSVNEHHQKAVKTLMDIFDWLGGLKSQATTEITLLYNKSSEIERKINDTLVRMTQLAEALNDLKKLVGDSKGTELVSCSKVLTTVHSPVFCRLILKQLISSWSFEGEFGLSIKAIRKTLSAIFHFVTPTATRSVRAALPLDVGN